jgi:alkaline phosphatase
MVVACTATHATPAAFIAHRELRAYTEEIALDYLKTDIDCFIGGGEALFNERPDRLNLEDSLRQRGYVLRRGTTFRKLPLDGSAPFMQFTHEREPPTASGGRDYMPGATEIACNFLQKRSKKGFFLMVEGSQIDWAGHANDRNWLRAEMKDFDKTVTRALEFAASNGETLVIVTGDHECGGLALNKGSNRKMFETSFSTHLHTGVMVPVYAYGPQQQLFNGVYENTSLYDKMRTALGFVTAQ